MTGETPTWKAAFSGSLSRLWRTEGKLSWERLGDGLISPYERSLVAADQNLCDSTVQRMVEARNGETKREIKWHFGEPEAGKRNSNDDIGWAALSYCIKQDRNATWAEIVARYALLRRIPYIDAALCLKQIHKEQGLFYFDDVTSAPVKWTPRPAYRERVNLQNDWDVLESLQVH